MERLNRRQLLKVLSASALIYPAIGCKTRSDVLERSASAGWIKSSKTQVFTPDNLWQHLDGEAQQYIDGGLTSLTTCDYQYNHLTRAVVDVFSMQDADAARRMFRAKRANGAQDIQIGDSGVTYEHSILFYKGKWIVRLFTYERGTDALEQLLVLARNIAGQL
jgi:hypothetical protein